MNWNEKREKDDHDENIYLVLVKCGLQNVPWKYSIIHIRACLHLIKVASAHIKSNYKGIGSYKRCCHIYNQGFYLYCYSIEKYTAQKFHSIYVQILPYFQTRKDFRHYLCSKIPRQDTKKVLSISYEKIS